MRKNNWLKNKIIRWVSIRGIAKYDILCMGPARFYSQYKTANNNRNSALSLFKTILNHWFLLG